jgi:DNA-binding beta-propeller fold protein YncE
MLAFSVNKTVFVKETDSYDTVLEIPYDCETMAFSADGALIVLADEDGRLDVFRIADGSSVVSMRTVPLTKVVFPDSNTVVGYTGNTVVVCDLRKLTVREIEHYDSIMDISSDGQMVIVDADELSFVDSENADRVHAVVPIINGCIGAAGFSRDGRTAFVQIDSTVIVCSVDGRILSILCREELRVQFHVALNTTGSKLAVVDDVRLTRYSVGSRCIEKSILVNEVASDVLLMEDDRVFLPYKHEGTIIVLKNYNLSSKEFILDDNSEPFQNLGPVVVFEPLSVLL